MLLQTSNAIIAAATTIDALDKECLVLIFELVGQRERLTSVAVVKQAVVQRHQFCVLAVA